MIHFLATTKNMTNHEKIKNKQASRQMIAFCDYDEDLCAHTLCGQHYITLVHSVIGPRPWSLGHCAFLSVIALGE